MWLEVLEGVREIKAGGGNTRVEAKSRVVRVRLKSGLSQAQFAAVSRSIQFSPFVGIENSPSPWLSRRLLGAHQAGFELLFEPVGVAADIQGDGMVQDAV